MALTNVEFVRKGNLVSVTEEGAVKTVFDSYHTDKSAPFLNYRIDFTDGSYTNLRSADMVFIYNESDPYLCAIGKCNCESMDN
jgi:hypothetical protein